MKILKRYFNIIHHSETESTFHNAQEPPLIYEDTDTPLMPEQNSEYSM